MEKETYYKLSVVGEKQWCCYHKNHIGEAVIDWLDGMSNGDSIKVQKVEMTEKEFDSLPEYEG